MELEQGRNVGAQGGDAIMALEPQIAQHAREPIDAVAELWVRVTTLAVNHRHALGVNGGAPVEERNGVELGATHAGGGGPWRERLGARADGRHCHRDLLRRGLTLTRSPPAGKWRIVALMSTLAGGATVLVRDDGAAARVTPNRPDKRNALSVEMMEDLLGELRRLSTAEEVRAIVLDAAGPVFSAGHDLSEMIGRDLPFFQRLFDLCSELMETIHRVPQPVIAQVEGMATAAGCQLVAACDLAVAAEDARFATPGVKIGLFCSTPMVPLSRAIGRKRALDMLLTGQAIDARTALDWGLVNRVVPSGSVEDEVRAIVDSIARSSPLT